MQIWDEDIYGRSIIGNKRRLQLLQLLQRGRFLFYYEKYILGHNLTSTTIIISHFLFTSKQWHSDLMHAHNIPLLLCIHDEKEILTIIHFDWFCLCVRWWNILMTFSQIWDCTLKAKWIKQTFKLSKANNQSVLLVLLKFSRFIFLIIMKLLQNLSRKICIILILIITEALHFLLIHLNFLKWIIFYISLK